MGENIEVRGEKEKWGFSFLYQPRLSLESNKSKSIWAFHFTLSLSRTLPLFPNFLSPTFALVLFVHTSYPLAFTETQSTRRQKQLERPKMVTV